MPPSLEPRTRLASAVDAMLAPEGRLAQAWPRFEDRAGQRVLAADIADTFERGGVLMAEAPTGIGKSLAYLLPAVLLAAEREVRVVVATCTRSLQDQLVDRDLPALCRALGTRVRVARLKGKQNYLCPRSLELAEGRGAEEDEAIESLRTWAAGENDGDLDRAPVPDGEAFRRLRSRVAASPTACTLATCRRGRDCPWVRARREAASSQLLIVNHALLARAGEAEGLLPEFDLLVVDEAHRLEGMLVSQLERSASRSRVDELLRVMGTPRATGRGSGLLGRLSAYVAPLLATGRAGFASDDLGRLARRAGEVRADVERLFARLDPRGTPRDAPRGSPATKDDRYDTRERYRTAGELLAGDLEPLQSSLDHCRHFARGLRRLAETLDRPGSGSAAVELAAELDQVSGQWAALEADLADLCGAERRDWVYWRTSGGRGVEVRGAPITAGEHVRRLVLSRAKSVVLTSATLSAGGDFAFAAERLGMGEEWGVPYQATRVESPFDLPRQMRCFVHGVPDEAAGVAELVARLARATGRRQLVLFTAHERLRRARARLQETLPEGTLLLAQEWDGGAAHVAARFRASAGSVLLGVQSLWEGVDFPGDELEILVVAKLPFSVPDDPRVEARAERLRDRGLDPFRDDAVPEAVLRFRQGIGRLIRRADDRGVLVVCDPRLLTAPYRRPFLEALPEPPVRLDDPAALALEASRFLSGAWAMEDHA